MPSRLRNKTARVSFFAFQDMITTVTGVLMIIMLLLSLDVTRRAATGTETERHKLTLQLEQAQNQFASNSELLRQRLAQLNLINNRVFVVPENDNSGKVPLLVVVSATNGVCCRLGQSNLTQFAEADGFRRLLGGWDAAHDRLVFYVRPSGIVFFETLRQAAISRSFSIGYDVAEEDKQYTMAAQ